MGGRIGTVSFLQILAPELTDRMLADFLDLDMGIGVNIHIKSIDQSEAIKTVKRKITDLDKMRLRNRKRRSEAVMIWILYRQTLRHSAVKQRIY